MYVINPYYRSNLQKDIEENYQLWLDFAKQQEYDKLAEKMREKRNKLLEETDKEMCLDRMNIDMPEEITMTTIVTGIRQFFTSLKGIFNSDMAKYRQELRDITKQEGFPYDVTFPEKPTNDKEG